MKEPNARAVTKDPAKKNKALFVAGGALILVVVVLVVLFPSKDICSDDVRGYEHSASSSLQAIRANLSKINASLSAEDSQKVPVQLEGLNAANFAALKACDTQCKLLGRCLRFVLTKPPSEACPTEYNDYKAKTESALSLLADLQGIETASKEAAEKAQVLDQDRQTVKDLENSSGSTGGRLAVLKARVQQSQKELELNRSAINAKLSVLAPKEIAP